MRDDDQINLEQTKLELSIYLEEYKALRAEIVAVLTSGYQSVTLTLTATGFLIAGSTFILQWQRPFLLVIASFVFYVLAWAQLRYLVSIYTASNHLIKRVFPRIRENLKNVSPSTERDFSKVMTWESEGRDLVHSGNLWLLPLEIARYGLPLIVAAVSFGAYLLVVWQRSQISLVVDGLLTLVNLLLVLYTTIVSFKVRSYTQKSKAPASPESLITDTPQHNNSLNPTAR